MIKNLFKKSTAILLVITTITSSLTFCLSGCNNVKRQSTSKNIYSQTYTDTKLETSSQSLTNIYNTFSSAVESNNSEKIKASANEFKNVVNQSVAEFTDYYEEINDKISNSNEIIKNRSAEFEKNVKHNSQKVLSAIDDIINNANDSDSDSYKEALNTIQEYLEVEDNNTVTSDNLENSISKKVSAKSIAVNNITDYEKNNVSAVGSYKPDEQSLALEDETALSDELKSLADNLKTPLQVYLYLKNHINYECYSGSRKGAVATFESNGGNDVDQASLLIAMLRYLNYPAKYVSGTIYITSDQALKLTSAKDLDTAGTILASSGKNVMSVISGGKIVGFQIDQTWVEAYIPYTDYRGAGNAAGDSRWIPLDTSIKEYNEVDTIYDDLEKYGISEKDYQKSLSANDIYEISNKLSDYEQKHLGEKIYLTSREINSESITYLPLSLQYVVKSIDGEYDKVKSSDSDSITFTIDGQNIAKLKSSEMYGKRLVIEYMPATDADAQTIKSFGSVFNTPSYLVKVVPTLKADDKIIGKGREVTLGQRETFNMSVYSQGETTYVTNSLTAGSMYQITQDMQTITEKELTSAFNEASSISANINIDNVYSSEYLGKILDMAGKLYYSHVDIADHVLAEKNNISITRSLSVGMTGYQVSSTLMFGIPVGIAEGSLYIDIDLNNVSAISREGSKKSELEYITASGMLSSSYEGVIWSEITGESGVSTISVLEEAESQGQSVLMLSSKNFESQKSKLHLDQTTFNAVKQAVDAEKIVTVHTDKVTYGDWEGFGYIITTPETGGAAYMISGGINGGSTDGLVSLAYLVNIGTSIVDVIDALRMIPLMLDLFVMGGPVGIIAGVVVGAIITALVITAIIDYVNSISLMSRYMSGDESAGEELELYAVINVGSSVLGAAAGAVGRAAATKIAKHRIINELGEELAEKILKNADDPADIARSIKKLNKQGVAKETIKEIANEFGEKGLKAARHGNGAVEVVLRYRNDAIKLINEYGDDAVNAIADRGRKSIDLINKHGKDAATAIANYSDKAVKFIEDYGKDAATAIAKNGDSAVELITKHGQNAATAIANNGKKAVKLITDYGGNAAKAIANYGDDAVKAIANYGDDAVNAIQKCADGKDAIWLMKEYGSDAASAIAKYGDDAALCIAEYGKDVLKPLKNSIEPNDIITIVEDRKIKLSDFDKFGITGNKAAKEVSENGYNKAIVNFEFKGNVNADISDDFIKLHYQNYKDYFMLKAAGKPRAEINQELLDITLISKNVEKDEINEVKKVIENAFDSSKKIDPDLSEDLFYDIKNGLVPYDPEKQFPNAYAEWKNQFGTTDTDGVSYFINKADYKNYVEQYNVFGREENGKSELYVLTKKEADDVEHLSKNAMEDALGLARGKFEKGGYRIDIPGSQIKNLRFSTPEDLGANAWWVPGCRTSNGLYEAAIDQVKNAKELSKQRVVKLTELIFDSKNN